MRIFVQELKNQGITRRRTLGTPPERIPADLPAFGGLSQLVRRFLAGLSRLSHDEGRKIAQKNHLRMETR